MSDLKTSVTASLTRVGNCFRQDFDAIDADRLDSSPGGVARTPFDLAHELAFINDRIALQPKGETLPPLDFSNGWMKAPDELKDRGSAVARFTDALDNLLAAWEAIPEDKVWDEIETAKGKTNAYDSMMVAIRHIAYHDGQLCYLQAIHGDNDLHWS